MSEPTLLPTEPLHKAPPPVQLRKAPWWTGCVGDLANVNHSLFCSGRHGRKEKRFGVKLLDDVSEIRFAV